MPEDSTPTTADRRLGRDLALYTAARVGLVGVLTGLLVLAGVPFLVGLAVAVVVGLPLGLLLFRGLNRRVTAELAVRGAHRTAERERLRAKLRGEDPE